MKDWTSRAHSHMHITVKNVVYRNTPGEQYFTVSMVTHTVTTETVKFCSPGVFSYTAIFTVIGEAMHTSLPLRENQQLEKQSVYARTLK